MRARIFLFAALFSTHIHAAPLNTVHSYIPREVIVPPNGEVDRLLETEPAINDDVEGRRMKGAMLDGVSERELKRVARQLRG